MKKFTKFFMPVMMLLLLPAVVVQGYTISGFVFYGTGIGPGKPMPFTEVFLLNLNGTSTPYYDIADNTGFYVITGVPNGTYYIAGESCTGWGGLDLDDRVRVKRYLIGQSNGLITDLQKRAADVNQSGTINQVDINLMTLLRPPVHPQWKDPYEMVWDGPFVPGWPGTGKLITVNGAPIPSHDVWCLFTGDVNGSFFPSFRFKDDRDGRVYPTIQIDRQCWMRRNLDVGTMINSYTVGDQTNNMIIEKYCYDNSIGNCNVYGGLYQWDEMMQYSPPPTYPDVVQGICPAGWHIPTHEEWCTLEYFIDPGITNCNATGWRGTNGGGRLKETGTAHWLTPNTGATNDFNFTAFGGGVWYDSSEGDYFGDLNWFGFFWSSDNANDPLNPDYRVNRTLYFNYSTIRLGWDLKQRGYSVRCIKHLPN